jgi:hypothetical protein
METNQNKMVKLIRIEELLEEIGLTHGEELASYYAGLMVKWLERQKTEEKEIEFYG